MSHARNSLQLPVLHVVVFLWVVLYVNNDDSLNANLPPVCKYILRFCFMFVFYPTLLSKRVQLFAYTCQLCEPHYT